MAKQQFNARLSEDTFFMIADLITRLGCKSQAGLIERLVADAHSADVNARGAILTPAVIDRVIAAAKFKEPTNVEIPARESAPGRRKKKGKKDGQHTTSVNGVGSRTASKRACGKTRNQQESIANGSDGLHERGNDNAVDLNASAAPSIIPQNICVICGGGFVGMTSPKWFVGCKVLHGDSWAHSACLEKPGGKSK